MGQSTKQDDIWYHCDNETVCTVLAVLLFIVNLIAGSVVISLLCSNGCDQSISITSVVGQLKRKIDEKYEQVNTGIVSPAQRRKTAGTDTPSLEFLSLLKPVVHLSAFDSIQNEDIKYQTSSIRNWVVPKQNGNGHIYNGIQYEIGNIMVPATGIYFVYGHLQFCIDGDEKEVDIKNGLYYNIVRYNVLTEGEEVVLSNEITPWEEDFNFGVIMKYPSDLRGVVHLNTGDRLIVKLSHYSLLCLDSEWHYIGAYLI